MGTILKRSREDGFVAWLAQIVIKSGGKIVLREYKIFGLGSTANACLCKPKDQLGLPDQTRCIQSSRHRADAWQAPEIVERNLSERESHPD